MLMEYASGGDLLTQIKQKIEQRSNFSE